MDETIDQRVPVRSNILTHEVADTDEVVIYDSQNRQLLVLNDFAAGVWLLIDGQRSVDDLKAAVLDCVSADPETVGRDIVEFLQQLEAKRIVQWQAG